MNLLLAVYYSMFANAHRDKVARPKPYTVDDFLLNGKAKPSSGNMTPEEMIAVGQQWKAVLG